MPWPPLREQIDRILYGAMWVMVWVCVVLFVALIAVLIFGPGVPK